MICLLRFASWQNQKYLSAVMSLKESFGKICFYFRLKNLNLKSIMTKHLHAESYPPSTVLMSFIPTSCFFFKSVCMSLLQFGITFVYLMCVCVCVCQHVSSQI